LKGVDVLKLLKIEKLKSLWGNPAELSIGQRNWVAFKAFLFYEVV